MLQSEHLGPIDVAVIGFVGGAKRDEVAAAIIDLVDAGTVRIIDLAYVEKDLDGEVGMLEVVDADIADAFAAIDESFDLLNEEEILAVGDELEPGSGALPRGGDGSSGSGSGPRPTGRGQHPRGSGHGQKRRLCSDRQGLYQ